MSKLKHIISFLDGFRKLSIMLLIIVITTTLLVLSFINGDIYARILVVAIPSYFASNVGEHATNRIKEWIEVLKRKKE